MLTKAGKGRVNLAQYLTIIKAARANAFVTLTAPLPYHSSKKRSRIVVVRSVIFMVDLVRAIM